ncbi:MAG: family 10 glycosylhydrolase [Xenococcaceae cyanobacterium MO_234.B1]|nr:family 10 glycosylhydrolase [Xenococcaceae cyanobacterium MO_234.B1]
MLGNASRWQQLSTGLSFLPNLKQKALLKLAYSLLSLTLLKSPAMATGEVLGVVKSRDNAGQWSQIVSRLERVGIKYCIVETANWKAEPDLGNIRVLFLPSIETLNAVQANMIEQWMNRGGKVIVSGPTGNLSRYDIRSQLRSLFGAYWAYPLSSASNLELTSNTPPEWFGREQLQKSLMGAVLFPSGSNSQTAAVWLDEKESPAAIVTDNSTVLGWRWGVEAVADANLDAAWLKAALNRYGISTYGKFTPTRYTPATSCRPRGIPQQEEPQQPFIPGWQLERSQSSINSIRGINLSSSQIQQMTQELEGLIGRFESTLLTADALESNLDLSTTKAIQQLLSQDIKSKQEPGKQVKSSPYGNAHQALQEARNKLQKFSSLAKKGRSAQAQVQWLEARRTLWDNYPTDRKVSKSEVRAIWLDRGTIVKTRSESDLAKIFDNMAKAGINMVFFETVNSGYTIHPSKVAPEQNPLVRGWDPLKAAVKLAHERGMELHAWVWVFATVNQRHNTILNQPEDYLGPVLSRYPDWAITDKEGNRFHHSSRKAFLDPANPGVQRYLTLLLEEIATNYDVDGIQLDYIRYPFQNHDGSINFGYGIAARQEFQKLTGVDPIDLNLSDPLWTQWTGFRIKQVDNFVASVSQRLKEKRPDLILSTAVFPMPRHKRLNKIQQHWEEWVRQEWIDMLVPMTYALDAEQLTELTRPLFEQKTLLKQRNEGTALLLPGIRLLNVPDIVAVDQMQLLRGMITQGFAFFAAENFNSSLVNIFSRTNGNTNKQQPQPLPHRQPFQAALSRYNNLQKEWNFFLSNNQLSMNESTLKEWGRQADELASVLTKLADDPSKRHLLSAQLTLSSLRRKFPRWLKEDKEDKTISPYQAAVWENNLASLERLLSYGDSRMLKDK